MGPYMSTSPQTNAAAAETVSLLAAHAAQDMGKPAVIDLTDSPTPETSSSEGHRGEGGGAGGGAGVGSASSPTTGVQTTASASADGACTSPAVPKLYDLASVIVHRGGSAGSGHYTAVCAEDLAAAAATAAPAADADGGANATPLAASLRQVSVDTKQRSLGDTAAVATVPPPPAAAATSASASAPQVEPAASPAAALSGSEAALARQWRLCNDTRVTLISEDVVARTEGYILLYVARH